MPDQPKKPRARVTMDDIAARAGVSKITVSRALRNFSNVNADTRRRVLEAARAAGYRLNLPARNLRLNRSHTIAVVIEMDPSVERPMTDPYPLSLLGGISQELANAGFGLLLTTLRSLDGPAVHAAEGVILLGQGPGGSAVEVVRKLGLPCVVWGEAKRRDSYCVVGSDNVHGGELAAERLYSLGRRRLAFCGDARHAEVAARLEGFKRFAATHNCAVVAEVPCEFSFPAGAAAVARLVADEIAIDGVFAASDSIAMGVVRALIDRGHRVPEDVSVIGYDDMPIGASFVPALTTVRQDWAAGGGSLARKVVLAIAGQRVDPEQLPTQLIIRST